MQSHCQLDALRIVFRDEAVVAVHKPAALLVHRSMIDRHETRFALQMTRDLVGQRVYAVHRLDKATSGLLLFALDPEGTRHLSSQFERHAVRKTYLALVRGWPEAAGCIDKPLHYKADRHADADRASPPQPQRAVTRYRRLGTTVLDRPLGRFAQQRYALLEVMPETGRKHQIRRHLNHIGHPIIGDVNHGDRHHNHLFYDWRGYHRLYLAATELRFIHPVTQQPLHIRAPLQDDFRDTLDALQLIPPPAASGVD